ncbi:MAG: efflux RND transporter periplasmic adaptor subunit [Rhodothermales bacterium]
MKKRTRWMLIAAGVAVVLVILIVATSGSAIEVETARITRDTLDVGVTEEGRTRVRERYVIAAPVTGRLGRILLDAGDTVDEETMVARIFPTPEDRRGLDVSRARAEAAEARRREAAARVEEGQAQAQQAERDAERGRTLARDSIFSQQELEQAELAAAAAQRRLDAARAMLRAAEADEAAARAALTGANPQDANNEAVAVRAPSAGRVLRVLEESERVVQAGTPLVEIGDAAGLDVVVDVLSEDAVQIRPGDAVRIENWGGDSILHGRVRLVEPDAFTEVSALGVEEQRVNVIADLFDPPPALGSGYRVEAYIITWTGEDVLTVPTSALFQQDGTWHVFAVEDGKASLRSIKIGHRSARAAEVVEGLDEGDEVILFPSDQIQEGVDVQSRQG